MRIPKWLNPPKGKSPKVYSWEVQEDASDILYQAVQYTIEEFPEYKDEISMVPSINYEDIDAIKEAYQRAISLANMIKGSPKHRYDVKWFIYNKTYDVLREYRFV